VSTLKMAEKGCFEDFGMSSGYVLDFSNRTFAEFFRESVRIDIYNEKYTIGGDSKARRLRAFWEIETDSVVGKALAELLDYWRYKNPQPNEQDKFLVQRAEQIVERLLGQQVQRGNSQEEFLKRQFGELSLKTIQVDAPVLPILESRLSEVMRCLGADAPLAVIFHCGSLLEGLLLGVASANPQQFNQASNSPKDISGKVKQFHNWKLAGFIDVACELGLLKLDVKKFGHSLRDFRNYIHPYEQMSSRFNPDKHTAQICLQVLKAAIASLSRERGQ
jgi:hypothetical protein